MTHIFSFSPKIREISCTKGPLICFPDHVMGSHRFRHHCQAFLLPALKPLCLCVELNLLQDQRVPGEALHCVPLTCQFLSSGPCVMSKTPVYLFVFPNVASYFLP